MIVLIGRKSGPRGAHDSGCRLLTIVAYQPSIGGKWHGFLVGKIKIIIVKGSLWVNLKERYNKHKALFGRQEKL